MKKTLQEALLILMPLVGLGLFIAAFFPNALADELRFALLGSGAAIIFGWTAFIKTIGRRYRAQVSELLARDANATDSKKPSVHSYTVAEIMSLTAMWAGITATLASLYQYVTTIDEPRYFAIGSGLVVMAGGYYVYRRQRLARLGVTCTSCQKRFIPIQQLLLADAGRCAKCTKSLWRAPKQLRTLESIVLVSVFILVIYGVFPVCNWAQEVFGKPAFVTAPTYAAFVIAATLSFGSWLLRSTDYVGFFFARLNSGESGLVERFDNVRIWSNSPPALTEAARSKYQEFRARVSDWFGEPKRMKPLRMIIFRELPQLQRYFKIPFERHGGIYQQATNPCFVVRDRLPDELHDSERQFNGLAFYFAQQIRPGNVQDWPLRSLSAGLTLFADQHSRHALLRFGRCLLGSNRWLTTADWLGNENSAAHPPHYENPASPFSTANIRQIQRELAGLYLLGPTATPDQRQQYHRFLLDPDCMSARREAAFQQHCGRTYEQLDTELQAWILDQPRPPFLAPSADNERIIRDIFLPTITDPAAPLDRRLLYVRRLSLGGYLTGLDTLIPLVTALPDDPREIADLRHAILETLQCVSGETFDANADRWLQWFREQTPEPVTASPTT